MAARARSKRKAKPKPKPKPKLDADGRTALHHAVLRKDAAEVLRLLRAGADYEAKDAAGIPATQLMYRERHDARGNVTFERLHGFKPVEQAFFTWMTDPACLGSLTFINAANLYNHIHNDKVGLARRELDSGGVWDLDIRLADGTTPLHLAAKRGNPRMVELLLDHEMEIGRDGVTKRYARADPTARDRAGKTPRDYAVEHGHAAVVALLDRRARR